MPNVIGVQFQKAGKLEYYTPNDIQVDIEDWVVVESKRGIEIGIVKNPLMDIAGYLLKILFALLMTKILINLIVMNEMLKMH